jgi:hypothetical protein
MASWSPPLQTARRPGRDTAEHRPRQRGVLRLGQRVVSDRDARLLARRLVEAKHQLAIEAARTAPTDDTARALCDAARARVADDLELVSAALERSQQSPGY